MTTTSRTAAAIRREFLDYFAEKYKHTIVPSAPVVPHDDPTLLFTNAGMNQFKDVFLGQGSREYTRAVDTQKCIRAGGKHNDLEDVGRDTYHHTFFEMLGNWSFGDYFKEEAIQWAWQLLTDVWGLDPERLHVTVFEGDDADGTQADLEAENIWQKFVPADRIQRFGKKDNFWEMGETGPCGPCSEIHYDATPDKSGKALVNADDPRVIEIWNLVFIQFNRGPDGKLTILPDKHVDTGMGFERIVRVLQEKSSNYDTDIFLPIFDAIAEKSGGRQYRTGESNDAVDVAYRIIADHLRCLTVAIADGATPSNEGRGYVLRRILRRAVRHANQTLKCKQPVLFEVVTAVVDSLRDAFPGLQAQQERVMEIVKAEEASFLQTIERGLALFEEAAGYPHAPRGPGVDGGDEQDDTSHHAEHGGTSSHTERGATKVISAEAAFKLHDTYGFPIDLTRTMAEERGMSVDEDGFEKLMEEARKKSRHTGEVGDIDFTLPPDALAKLRNMNIPATVDDDKFHGRAVSSEVRAIWDGNNFENNVGIGRRVAVITERTSFYAEQGGQVGDKGFILTNQNTGSIGGWGFESNMPKGACRFEVDDAKRVGEYVLHIGQVVDGKLRVGDKCMVDVDDNIRNPTKSNHTATHLLNHALRQVLGDGVEQKGSLVAADKLRFDFSFNRGLTNDELNAVERLTNAAIHQKLPVHIEEVPLDTAMQVTGVRAVFGEKYPDPVRMVSIGPSIGRLLAEPNLPRWKECSIEFCGGTHLENSSEARRFVIVSEQALAAGVRRIVAVTGPAAMAAESAGRDLESRAFKAKSLDGQQLIDEVGEISSLVEELTIGSVSRQKIHHLLDDLRAKAKQARKASQSESRQVVVNQARTIAEQARGNVIVEQIANADKETLRAAMDVIRSKCQDAAVLLMTGDLEESKVAMVASVPEALIKKGLKAGNWVRETAKVVGGGGGGRPDMAEAGGKDPTKIPAAITKAQDFADATV